MKRNENENFEDYKLRLKAAKAELREKRKGVYKQVPVWDGEKEVMVPAITRTNRRQRRENPGRLFNNSKGIQLVVVGNDKYRKEVQVIDDKRIVHSVLVPRSHSGKVAQPKTI